MYKKKSLGIGNSRDPEKLAVICFLFLMVVWRLEAMISFFLVVLITQASGIPSGTASGTYDDVHFFIKIIVSFLGGCVGKKKKIKKRVPTVLGKTKNGKKGPTSTRRRKKDRKKKGPATLLAKNYSTQAINTRL